MNDYWYIASKEDVKFAVCMEDVLDLYELPYNSMHLLVYMNEKHIGF